jgi:phage baseplate assembly protein gpV
MSDLIATLRAIIRDELDRRRAPELGLVTEVFARDSSSSENNHQVNVRLRESGVELQRVPVAAARLGLSVLPAVDDPVVVVFLGGDLNAPVVVGSIYDADLNPPEAKPAEAVYQPADPPDASVRRLHLELSSGSRITLDDDKLTLVFGGTELKVKRDGDIEVKSAARLVIESAGDVTVKAGGNLELSAQGNVTVKGVSALVEGQAEAKLKGPLVGLAGNTSFSPS